MRVLLSSSSNRSPETTCFSIYTPDQTYYLEFDNSLSPGQFGAGVGQSFRIIEKIIHADPIARQCIGFILESLDCGDFNTFDRRRVLFTNKLIAYYNLQDEEKNTARLFFNSLKEDVLFSHSAYVKKRNLQFDLEDKNRELLFKKKCRLQNCIVRLLNCIDSDSIQDGKNLNVILADIFQFENYESRENASLILNSLAYLVSNTEPDANFLFGLSFLCSNRIIYLQALKSEKTDLFFCLIQKSAEINLEKLNRDICQ